MLLFCVHKNNSMRSFQIYPAIFVGPVHKYIQTARMPSAPRFGESELLLPLLALRKTSKLQLVLNAASCSFTGLSSHAHITPP